MPAPGAKPKAGEKHGRTPQAHDWTEVENVPYEGDHPDLPDERRVEWVDKDGRHTQDVPLRPETRAWWESISSMPHCRLWSMSDWVFAVSSALIADMVFSGDGVRAGELRQREKIMGATFDSRRDLRIRYVEPAGAKGAGAAPVVNLNTRRSRLTAS